jgi:hypothetical protein
MHVRYLATQDGIFPDEVLEDYIRLFPDRPILPHIRSIKFLMDTESCLSYLIRSSTPPENQPSASASTLRSLSIYRTLRNDPSDEDERLARDLVAFQRSNGKLGGGLEEFQDFLPFPERGRYYYTPAGCAFQESMENAFALPPPETADSPEHGLRRLEVTHYIRELPDFFGRVAKMRALEHLKIAIADPDARWDTGIEEVIQHTVSSLYTVSSLEIEGRWNELFTAINSCASPSASAQLRTLRLYYYLTDLPPTQSEAVQVLDLPTGIIPPDHLESLTIELLDNEEDIPNCVYMGIGEAIKVDALRSLLRYRQMVKLHLGLPCNILVDIEFFYTLAAVMRETLKHLVVLRRLTQWDEDDFKPVLTADDLPTIAGVIMPRLETLGLDVSYDEISSSSKRNSLVVSCLLRTLDVGTIKLSKVQIPQVAGFLREHFPALQWLYHHYAEPAAPWRRVVKINGYRH